MNLALLTPAEQKAFSLRIYQRGVADGRVAERESLLPVIQRLANERPQTFSDPPAATPAKRRQFMHIFDEDQFDDAFGQFFHDDNYPEGLPRHVAKFFGMPEDEFGRRSGRELFEVVSEEPNGRTVHRWLDPKRVEGIEEATDDFAADRSKLRRVQITNKNGVRTWVWVNPGKDKPGDGEGKKTPENADDEKAKSTEKATPAKPAAPRTEHPANAARPDADYHATAVSEQAVASAFQNAGSLKPEQIAGLATHMDVLQKTKLQELARNVKARLSGRKAEIVERLLTHLRSQQPTPAKPPAPQLPPPENPPMSPGELHDLHKDALTVLDRAKRKVEANPTDGHARNELASAQDRLAGVQKDYPLPEGTPPPTVEPPSPAVTPPPRENPMERLARQDRERPASKDNFPLTLAGIRAAQAQERAANPPASKPVASPPANPALDEISKGIADDATGGSIERGPGGRGRNPDEIKDRSGVSPNDRKAVGSAAQNPKPSGAAQIPPRGISPDEHAKRLTQRRGELKQQQDDSRRRAYFAKNFPAIAPLATAYPGASDRVKKHIDATMFNLGQNPNPQQIARSLTSEWLDLHKEGASPAEMQPFEAAMQANGMRQIGAAGERTPFRGDLHDSGPGAFTGDKHEVVRPGWELPKEGGGSYVTSKAQTKPEDGAGRPTGGSKEPASKKGPVEPTNPTSPATKPPAAATKPTATTEPDYAKPKPGQKAVYSDPKQGLYLHKNDKTGAIATALPDEPQRKAIVAKIAPAIASAWEDQIGPMMKRLSFLPVSDVVALIQREAPAATTGDVQAALFQLAKDRQVYLRSDVSAAKLSTDKDRAENAIWDGKGDALNYVSLAAGNKDPDLSGYK